MVSSLFFRCLLTLISHMLQHCINGTHLNFILLLNLMQIYKHTTDAILIPTSFQQAIGQGQGPGHDGVHVVVFVFGQPA